MSYEVKLTAEQFKEFMNALTIASSYLDDVIIENGLIRQKTPDGSTLIEMDISSVFPKSLSIITIKTKLKTMAPILLDESDVIIKCNDRFWYVIVDSGKQFGIEFPLGRHTATGFIKDDVFQKVFGVDAADNRKLFEIDLQERSDVHKKIKVVCEAFASDVLKFKIKDNDISIEITAMDKRQKATVFKCKNDTPYKDVTISFRSSFLESVESKILTNLVFYKESSNVRVKNGKKHKSSVTKIVGEIDSFKLTIYTHCSYVSTDVINETEIIQPQQPVVETAVNNQIEEVNVQPPIEPNNIPQQESIPVNQTQVPNNNPTQQTQPATPNIVVDSISGIGNLSI